MVRLRNMIRISFYDGPIVICCCFTMLMVISTFLQASAMMPTKEKDTEFFDIISKYPFTLKHNSDWQWNYTNGGIIIYGKNISSNAISQIIANEINGSAPFITISSIDGPKEKVIGNHIINPIVKIENYSIVEIADDPNAVQLQMSLKNKTIDIKALATIIEHQIGNSEGVFSILYLAKPAIFNEYYDEVYDMIKTLRFFNYANSPENDDLWIQGLLLHNAGNFSGAIHEYDKALSLDPNDTQVLINKGITLMAMNHDEDAIKILDKALSIKPNDLEALLNKAIAFSKMGNYTNSLSLYNEILKIDPNNTEAVKFKELINRNI